MKFNWKSHVDFVYSVLAMLFSPLNYIFHIKIHYIFLIVIVK